ncbi:MAG: hypothetical protein IJA53_01320 [Spirochaetaceae bacterium]|nr:hypothetical protein [Spirochaetaceae bacterium]
MKKLFNVMKIALCLMAILGFIGCEQETPAPTPTPEKDYSATVSVESIELTAGESKTFTVASKDGTWLVYDEDLDPEQISVVLEDGVCTVTSLKDADYDGTITLYESEERADDIVIPFTITYPYVDVTINFSEFTLTQDDVLTVHYGNNENSDFEDIEATISEDGKSAIAKFKKELANEWFWYNGITFSATVGEDTIALRPTSDSTNNFCYTDTETWPNGVILTIEKTPTEAEYMPVTINLENIEDVETVEVTYGYDGIDYVAAEVTLNADKTQATTSLSSDYKNGDGWLEIKVVLKDAEGNVIEGYTDSRDNTWVAFTTDELSFKLYNVVAEFTDLCVDKELTLPGSGYTQILEASVFEGLTIKSLKVTLVNADGTWSSLSAANGWVADTYQDKCHDTTTYIDSSTFITALAINGLWIESDSTSATVTVSYTTE